MDEGLRTLMDFRYKRHFKAERGEHGMSKGMHGRRAEDLIVKVPPGTVVINAETKAVIADLVEDGQRAVIAKQVVEAVGIHALQLQQTLPQSLLKKVNRVKNWM